MKLIQWCKQHDKLAHFVIISIITYLYIPLELLYCKGDLIFILVSIISIGKEIYDEFKPNKTGFDVFDLLTDMLAYIINIHIIHIIWQV